jgi:tRNA nucleotidyltransferase (CCA-adding enzyme)
LRSRQIRVLHPNSFIEDPTRIYRAVRFAVRLGFEIESQTEEYIRYAIASGVYERLRLENHQAPALTTRLRTELKYILQANYWKPALKLLADLEALRCLHQDLILTQELWWQIRCVSRWLKFIAPEDNFSHWLIRLEVLIAHLKASERGKVATNLQLPKDSIQRLKRLAQIETEVIEKLPHCHKPSEIYLLLRQYKYVGLILLAVRTPKSIRRTLWQYLTKLAKVEPLLNGNDLKELGYKPGPIYKQMLDDLLIATLDGEITSRPEAEALIQQNY